jgi:hypothetical protein
VWVQARVVPAGMKTALGQAYTDMHPGDCRRWVYWNLPYVRQGRWAGWLDRCRGGCAAFSGFIRSLVSYICPGPRDELRLAGGPGPQHMPVALRVLVVTHPTDLPPDPTTHLFLQATRLMTCSSTSISSGPQHQPGTWATNDSQYIFAQMGLT